MNKETAFLSTRPHITATHTSAANFSLPEEVVASIPKKAPSIAFAMISFWRDQHMAVQAVRSIRLFYPKAPILILDDANWPMQPKVARQLVKLGVCYRKSDWERGKSTKERSNFTRNHMASQCAAFADFASEVGTDILCKIDSDVIVTGADLPMWLGSNNMIMAASIRRDAVHGWCYLMRRKSLQEIAALQKMGRFKDHQCKFEDVYHREIFREAFGPEAVLDYEINKETSRSYTMDYAHPKEIIPEYHKGLLRYVTVNFGGLMMIDLPSPEARRERATAHMKAFVDFLEDKIKSTSQ
ncbi:hypothetical protein OAG69_00225 [bacterium]|nr:hypothetical protein [bacterium]